MKLTFKDKSEIEKKYKTWGDCVGKVVKYGVCTNWGYLVSSEDGDNIRATVVGHNVYASCTLIEPRDKPLAPDAKVYDVEMILTEVQS
jgi:hypothetical protein